MEMEEDEMMHELVGCEIVDIFRSDDLGYLVFDTDKGRLSFIAMGDCCSVSWFNDAIGVSNLLGQRVNLVEYLDLPDNISERPNKSDFDDDSIAYYGIKLSTKKGDCIIAFRNASNGYYGGWVERIKQLPSDIHLIPVIDDW